jgi:hypothetical protein
MGLIIGAKATRRSVEKSDSNQAIRTRMETVRKISARLWKAALQNPLWLAAALGAVGLVFLFVYPKLPPDP